MHISPRRVGIMLALALAVWQLGGASYIEAKAWLAQELLEHAWNEAQRSGRAVKPWPWADTTPVARLGVARLGIDTIVLAGDSGRTLAFGPAWNEASTRPGEHGTVIISGHRDTHFAFLRALRVDDRITLDTGRGARTYRITGTDIVDVRTTRLDANGNDTLLLVTCYPFNALVPGGPLRYLVHAEPLSTPVSVAAR